LDYAEAQDDYVGLHTKGKVHLKQQTLAGLEQSLDPNRFVRIHRSYVLNVDRLARLETEGEGRAAVLVDGTRLAVSRAGYARLKALLRERAHSAEARRADPHKTKDCGRAEPGPVSH